MMETSAALGTRSPRTLKELPMNGAGPGAAAPGSISFQRLLEEKLEETQRALLHGYICAVQQELQRCCSRHLPPAAPDEKVAQANAHHNGQAGFQSDKVLQPKDHDLDSLRKRQEQAFALPPTPEEGLIVMSPLPPGCLQDDSKGALEESTSCAGSRQTSPAMSRQTSPFSPAGSRAGSRKAFDELAHANEGSKGDRISGTTMPDEMTETPSHPPPTEGKRSFLKRLSESTLNMNARERADLKMLEEGLTPDSTRAERLAVAARQLQFLLRSDAKGTDTFVGRCASSKQFEAFFSMVILCNAVFIAVSANHEATHIGGKKPFEIVAAECTFCGLYIVELFLRASAYRMRYFCSKDWSWNTFDCLLAIISIQELVLELGVNSQEDAMNMSFLRILRVMKMMKLFRLIRLMRMFRELRLIWSSIMGSLQAIFWAMVLIAVTSFMVGVCFVQATTNHLSDNKGNMSSESIELLTERWGSCQQAMLALFQCVSGGSDWAEFADSLKVVGNMYYALFLFFILFYTCVVTNTLTSLFVETTIANADKDQQYIIQNALENSDKYMQKLKRWFRDLDEDDSGLVEYDEFVKCLDDPHAWAFASTLGIEIMDLKQCFGVLSLGGTRAVDVNAFVDGCMKMRGNAKSMDMLALLAMEKDLTLEVREHVDFCRAEFENLNRNLGVHGSNAPGPRTRRNRMSMLCGS
eukprot:TRINITY_DN111276_c0_g1_i1.p1 TRINITY_DN111276_c0_g1~~TRINITY_DN111276_c0_g1_i1.p1  ORF type:complete len:718 (+),score=166.97 TRINITY_DN111276_c0_g1_i1:72-2156(+)